MKKRVSKAILFAQEQIILARERTTLSWIRFGVGILAVSVTILHFSYRNFERIAGFSLLAVGILLVSTQLLKLHKQKQIEEEIVKKTNL